MDPRERISNLDTAIATALKGLQTSLWTALPATVVSYDATKQTIQAQPTIELLYSDQFNFTKSITLPVCPDVPVVFPHGGGFSLTFPIQVGDECLLVFASRCIDGWWGYSGIQQAGDPRMHDLSDAFAIVGPRSRPNALALPAVSTSAVQLRSDDGNSYVEINPAGHITVKANSGLSAQVSGPAAITSDTSITLTAPPNTIKANGNPLG